MLVAWSLPGAAATIRRRPHLCSNRGVSGGAALTVEVVERSTSSRRLQMGSWLATNGSLSGLASLMPPDRLCVLEPKEAAMGQTSASSNVLRPTPTIGGPGKREWAVTHGTGDDG